MTEVYQI